MPVRSFRPFAILITIGVVGFVIALIFDLTHTPPAPPLTAVADTEPVRRLVSVSGVIESEQTARLSFPVAGTIASVPVRIGQVVATGDTLAALTTTTLLADRAEAIAALRVAEANRDELFTGLTSEAAAVTNETVRSAALALERVRLEQTQLVENARQNLYSGGLLARAIDATEESTPPTVTGTYTCPETGRYEIDVYSSNSDSGYSFRLSGLESGIYAASVNQPSAFGSCGLSLQFTAGERLSNGVWEIVIPNPNSPLYVTNKNAYDLARITAESRIRQAEQELQLAEATARNTTAPARAEAVARANAAVTQAQARVARLDAQLAERTLTAPFAGTITAVDFKTGESTGANSGITLVATTDFTVVARVPEIDIGEITVGQPATLVFDANPAFPQNGTVTYVAPTATFINGVAFFETRISLLDTPSWLRNGLNADVDITVAERADDVVRVPSRAISGYSNLPSVQVVTETGFSTTTITVELVGNDGYTAITGIPAGTTVLLP
jgi:multidrug efflux pump subunit AcrA (membrane-fusion protein)